MENLSSKILLSLLSILASIGTGIAFQACNEIQELNNNVIKMTEIQRFNSTEISKIDDRVKYLEKESVSTNLENHEKISEIEKAILNLDRWCRQWKKELDSR